MIWTSSVLRFVTSYLITKDSLTIQKSFSWETGANQKALLQDHKRYQSTLQWYASEKNNLLILFNSLNKIGSKNSTIYRQVLMTYVLIIYGINGTDILIITSDHYTFCSASHYEYGTYCSDEGFEGTSSSMHWSSSRRRVL